MGANPRNMKDMPAKPRQRRKNRRRSGAAAAAHRRTVHRYRGLAPAAKLFRRYAAAVRETGQRYGHRCWRSIKTRPRKAWSWLAPQRHRLKCLASDEHNDIVVLMLPDFDKDGKLPPGIHLAAWAEVAARFGWNKRRRRWRAIRLRRPITAHRHKAANGGDLRNHTPWRSISARPRQEAGRGGEDAAGAGRRLRACRCDGNAGEFRRVAADEVVAAR